MDGLNKMKRFIILLLKQKVNKSYTIKPGTTLYTVPWGNYNQIVEQYLNQINLHLKRVHHNK